MWDSRHLLRHSEAWMQRSEGLALLCLALAIAALITSLINVPANSCAMTYMRPFYHPVPVPHAAWRTRTSYALYLYREGRSDQRVTGLPVLFIPGNAGSGKQVRSLGAQAHEDLEELAQREGVHGGKAPAARLDFWAVDFEEELSALSGADLAAQARFVCNTIPFVLSQYATAPRGVVVVGHSMGGIIARLVASPQYCHTHHSAYQAAGETSEDALLHHVVAVFTIATPHVGLPVVADPLLRQIFAAGTSFWRSAFLADPNTTQAAGGRSPAAGVDDMVLVSLGGGERDILVGTERCDVYQMCPATHCMSVSTTALPEAWLSVDHRAALWCNQVVRRLTASLRSLAARGEGMSWVWGTGRAAKMSAIHQSLLAGPRMLQTLSYFPPDPPRNVQQCTSPRLTVNAAGGADGMPDARGGAETDDDDDALAVGDAWAHVLPWPVRWLSPPRDGPADVEVFLRLARVEEETVYLWRMPAVPSADGIGAALVVLSSMGLPGDWERDGGWRVLLCGEEADALALHAGEDGEGVRRACLGPDSSSVDVSLRAVSLQGSTCQVQSNADCVPSAGAHGGVKWLLSVAADELRPLQVLCLLGPRKGAGVGGGWLAALRGVPPGSMQDVRLPSTTLWNWVERDVDAGRMGAWYVPHVTAPGSTQPLPASLVLRESPVQVPGGCTPMFAPIVLQTSVQPWWEAIGEGGARAELRSGDVVPLWRQQRRAAWLSGFGGGGGRGEVVVLADPTCLYVARLRGDVWAAAGLAMRRHFARILTLAAAALCLRLIFARPGRGSGGAGAGAEAPKTVNAWSQMVALWVLVLAQPVLVCLLWARCSACRSVWGCTIGGALVSEMMAEAPATWGGGGWDVMGGVARDGANWSHMESPVVSALVVAAATGLSVLLMHVAAALRKLLRLLAWRSHPTPSPSRGRWFVGTVVAAVLGALHPFLAAVVALVVVVVEPGGAAPAGPRGEDEQEQVVGALATVSVIVRLPGVVALVRSLFVSAVGPEGRWSVLRDALVGGALAQAQGDVWLGRTVAETIDLGVSVLLPAAARLWSRSSLRHARSVERRGSTQVCTRSADKAPATGGGVCGAAGRAWACVLSGAGALAILMAQEDVYMVTWLLTYLLCVLVGLGGAAPKVNLS